MLETKRLVLRRWKESDAENFYRCAKDAEMGPSTGWKPHENEEESLQVIRDFVFRQVSFREIRKEETMRAAEIEQICFPPNEACSEKNMTERIAAAHEMFLAAIEKETGTMIGFLNGIATKEEKFRDEFFTDASLHDPEGKNIMLLGLDVLPEYRRRGLARELMHQYLKKEKERGRKKAFLTCLDSKVEMYQKFGFTDLGIADSSWGGEEWHEMSVDL